MLLLAGRDTGWFVRMENNKYTLNINNYVCERF